MFTRPHAARQVATLTVACLTAAWGCAPEGETGRVSGLGELNAASAKKDVAALNGEAAPQRQAASVRNLKNGSRLPGIHLQPAEASRPARIALTGLPPELLKQLGNPTGVDADSRLLAVFVDVDSIVAADAPLVIGALRVDGSELCFEPRYPLLPGTSYRVVFDPARLPKDAVGAVEGGVDGIGLASLEPIVAFIDVPPRTLTPETRLDRVFPSADVLPENQLKFYLHFSAPMSRGTSYEHVHLLREDGTEVKDVFLELPEELWNGDGTRFTLFFHPGRVKRGLVPREELGSALEEGKNYVLKIDADWPDANGAPLVEPVSKPFHVVPPDDVPPDHEQWKIAPPVAGGREPLTVAFPEPLDHAMLLRVLRVKNKAGEEIAGEVAVDPGETAWRFTPAESWSAGDYQLEADAALEDRAGNSLGRKFEVDVFDRVDDGPVKETVALPFAIK